MFAKELTKLLSNLNLCLKDYFNGVELRMRDGPGGCSVGWWKFFEAHAWRSTMEVEDRYYSMASNSCVFTLYVGYVCSLLSSLDADESGQAFAERLGGSSKGWGAGWTTPTWHSGRLDPADAPGPVCSGRKPSGRGKRARAEAATMLTTTALAVNLAPTKMIARARATTTAAAYKHQHV